MSNRLAYPDRQAVTVAFDPALNQATIEVSGAPVGTSFGGFAQGSTYIDARTAAKWFVFGLEVLGISPADLAPRDFLAAKNTAHRLLGTAAWSASRCGSTDAQSLECFFEAAFRGRLKDFEMATYRLRSIYPDTAHVVRTLRDSMRGSQWLREPAVADAESALRCVVPMN